MIWDRGNSGFWDWKELDSFPELKGVWLGQEAGGAESAPGRWLQHLDDIIVWTESVVSSWKEVHSTTKKKFWGTGDRMYWWIENGVWRPMARMIQDWTGWQALNGHRKGCCRMGPGSEPTARTGKTTAVFDSTMTREQNRTPVKVPAFAESLPKVPESRLQFPPVRIVQQKHQ